jgi:phosphatidylserine/phosphatidylglycerophosphate/cardiolipin synthase-like enzyme
MPNEMLLQAFSPSSHKRQQGSYDASEYLLNVEELAIASSRNAPRNSLHSLSSGVHTSDGQVQLFVNGNSYFEHMHKTVSSTKKGDLLLLTGWDVHTDFLLDPKIENYGDTGLLTQLTKAMERGVDVGVIWTFIGNVFDSPSMTAICRYLDKAWQQRTGDSTIGGCFFDTNIQETRFQSSHAKTMFVSVDGQPMAYVSGLDLAPQRWDMLGHGGAVRDEYLERQPSAGLAGVGTGWADTGAFVKGQLAIDVKTTFLQRWRDLPPKTSHSRS